MSRDPKCAPLPAAKFEPAMTETVEMTEVDGIKQGAVLQFTGASKSGMASQAREVKTCCGDLYVIINALRDYADILGNVIEEWGLTGCHAATYELHAARCRKTAGKYAAAIGYNYDRALKRCQKRRAKGERNSDTGMDGLEALTRNRELNLSKEEQADSTDNQREKSKNEQD